MAKNMLSLFKRTAKKKKSNRRVDTDRLATLLLLQATIRMDFSVSVDFDNYSENKAAHNKSVMNLVYAVIDCSKKIWKEPLKIKSISESDAGIRVDLTYSESVKEVIQACVKGNEL